MKNLLPVILFTFICVKSQSQLTTLWEKSAGSSYTWFTTSSGNTTGCAYNPVTNKLLLADRNNLIAIINVTTGASEGTLTTTPFVGTESFKWNKIRITSDGVIYGVSLTTSSPFLCKIYRWDNQTASPTLCASFNATERCGDAFGLSGSGNNTVLYVSGNGITSSAVNIYVLTTANGLDFALSNTINIPITGTNAWAGRSVDPISTGTASELWIRSQNTNTRRISSTGTVLFTSTDGAGANQVPSNFSNARYFTSSSGGKFLALMGTSSDATGGRKLRVLNVTNEAAITDVGTAELSSTYSTNTSGIGDVAIKDNGDGTFTLFYVITNNGVMAVQTNNLVPVNFSAFTGKLINNSVSLKWTTSTEINNKGFEVERSQDGTQFSSIGFVASKSLSGNATNKNDYTFEDAKILSGKSFYRLKQQDKDGAFHYSSIVSVSNLKNSFTASLVANPVKDEVEINLFTSETKTLLITAYTATGKVFYSKEMNVAIGNSNIQLRNASLPQGVFFIRLQSKQNKAETIILQAIHQ